MSDEPFSFKCTYKAGTKTVENLRQGTSKQGDHNQKWCTEEEWKAVNGF